MSNITPYTRSRYPSIEGNERLYFDSEFRRIEECLKSIIQTLKTPTDFGTATIASGVAILVNTMATPIGVANIDTESAAASDDLDTITWDSGVDGQIVTFYASDAARTVVFKDGTGNLNLSGDFTLDNDTDNITLQFFDGDWYQLCQSNNAA